MKKHIILAFLFTFFATDAFAYNYDLSAVAPSGQTLYYSIDDYSGHAYVIPPNGSTYNGYAKPTGALQIPSSVVYNGLAYPVTYIESWAFQGCTGLTTPNTYR